MSSARGSVIRVTSVPTPLATVKASGPCCAVAHSTSAATASPATAPYCALPHHAPRLACSAGMDGGFHLRDYQIDAADAALRNNLLIVLPTNSGKTVIAAEVVFRTLHAHKSKKVVFVAPKRTLALQQARLLLRHIGPLHLRSDERSNKKCEDPRWRLSIASGATWVNEDPGDLDVMHWRSAFVEAQCIVTTAELFERALSHSCGVRMDEIAHRHRHGMGGHGHELGPMRRQRVSRSRV